MMTSKRLKSNSGAIIAIGIMAFLLSLFWYSPILFGEVWKKLRNPPDPAIPDWTFLFAPIREIITAFVLASLILRLNLSSWKDATKLILLFWLAFHAVGMTGAILWDNMHWQLGAVHAGDWLMKMLFIGIAFTLWINRTSSSPKINRK